MTYELGVGEELLEPRLLDGREDELMIDYVKLVKSKLGEWLKNLNNSEIKEFVSREYPPDTDSSGLYMLSGSVIVFQMFNQQLDVVSTSSRGALLRDVVFECIDAISEFQENWIAALDSELKKFLVRPKPPAKDLEEGLPEYVMALANDCYRSTEFSEAMCKRVS
jgi:exocyst complex component 3